MTKSMTLPERVEATRVRYLEAKRFCRKTSLQLALLLALEKLQNMGAEQVSSAERVNVARRLHHCLTVVGAADKKQLPDFHPRALFDYSEASVTELDTLFLDKRFQNASEIVKISWGDIEAHFAEYFKKYGGSLPVGLRVFHEAYQSFQPLKKE